MEAEGWCHEVGELSGNRDPVDGWGRWVGQGWDGLGWGWLTHHEITDLKNSEFGVTQIW